MLVPSGNDLLELQLQRQLPAGDAADLRHELLLLEDLGLHQGVQGDGAGLQLDLLPDLLTMPIPHGRVPEVHDARHVALHLVDLLPDLLGHLVIETPRELIRHLGIFHDLLVHLLDVHLRELRLLPSVECDLPVVDQVPELGLLEEELLGLVHLDKLQGHGHVEQDLVLVVVGGPLLQLGHLCLDVAQLFQDHLRREDVGLRHEGAGTERLGDLPSFLLRHLRHGVQVLHHLIPLLADEGVPLDQLLVGEVASLRLQELHLHRVLPGHSHMVLAQELVHGLHLLPGFLELRFLGLDVVEGLDIVRVRGQVLGPVIQHLVGLVETVEHRLALLPCDVRQSPLHRAQAALGHRLQAGAEVPPIHHDDAHVVMRLVLIQVRLELAHEAHVSSEVLVGGGRRKVGLFIPTVAVVVDPAEKLEVLVREFLRGGDVGQDPLADSGRVVVELPVVMQDAFHRLRVSGPWGQMLHVVGHAQQ
mmetsp:Transcript_62928/g.150300  ORF Transcript_62928/g.150300 Transcript_62928/m.150300 type:complete len:474 (-) Transcript_62928:483-1904(-)